MPSPSMPDVDRVFYSIADNISPPIHDASVSDSVSDSDTIPIRHQTLHSNPRDWDSGTAHIEAYGSADEIPIRHQTLFDKPDQVSSLAVPLFVSPSHASEDAYDPAQPHAHGALSCIDDSYRRLEPRPKAATMSSLSFYPGEVVSKCVADGSLDRLRRWTSGCGRTDGRHHGCACYCARGGWLVVV